MAELILRSRKFGILNIYDEVARSKQEVVYITIFFKTPEHLYRFYRRDLFGPGVTEATEIDWSGFIMGARSLREDYETTLEWYDKTDKEKLAEVEAYIQELFDTDEIHGYHVEPIGYLEKYAEASDEDMWRREREVHNRLSALELEIRELRREQSALWKVGDEKYNWGDRL